ncbi:hypothetical protein HS7_10390 [Sulfolobales archaeon HS-7]|nr:hypothetical protein HS7_10390 [Sulfolobales archaeon HS-7]
MRGAIIAGIVVLILIIGGILGYTYFTMGNVKIYVVDAPSGLVITLTSTSIMLHKVTGGWVTVSNKTISFNLTSAAVLLVKAVIPAGKYNEMFIYVSNGSASILGLSVSLPSHVFKIHFVNNQDLVVGGMYNATVIINFPHISMNAGNLIITPSVTAVAYN